MILSHFTQEIIFLRAIIANALNLTRKLTLGFKSNLKNAPYIACGDTIYSPSLAEGARGWVDSLSLRDFAKQNRGNLAPFRHCEAHEQNKCNEAIHTK